MVVDVLTKAGPMKANGAMDQFLRSGQLSLVDVDHEIAARASGPRNKSRSHSTSVARLAREYEQQGQAFWSTLIGGCCEYEALVLGDHD